jgi:hypothetical protein
LKVHFLLKTILKLSHENDVNPNPNIRHTTSNITTVAASRTCRWCQHDFLHAAAYAKLWALHRRSSMFYRLLALAACGSLLAACTTVPTQTSSPRPKPLPAPLPSQANADWENLGVSPNGNILNELDKLSIKPQGSVVTFRDRKTIFNVKKENFLSTPRHKISINSWLIDCSARTFRLTSMVLFDENGRQIASYTYNDSQIKAMPVTQNSASYQQMQYVCKGLAGF